MNLQKNERNRGITLIALVVTIVVLLILAAVSISILTGEHGIIRQAQKAREEQNKAEKEENSTLTDMNDYINDKTNGGSKDELDKTIPNGFYYVGGTLESGIVISDNANDENKYENQAEVGKDLEGNQFVWIPVSNPESYLNSLDDEQLNDIDSQINEENKQITESIKKYGGFFISRFEISKENEQFVSKADKVADTNVTLQNAISNSRSMYTKDDSRYGATSSLIYGKQWDLAMEYLSNTTNLSDSSTYGNYYNYGEMEVDDNIITVTSSGATIDSLSNGKKQRIKFSIGLGSSSADVYMRFRIEKASGDFDLNEIVDENENIVKRGSNYYYMPRITKSQTITIPMYLEIGGNSKNEATTVQAKVRVEVIQADNFYPDFSVEEPWGDVVIEQYGKVDNIQKVANLKNDNRIQKLSNFKVENEIKVAWFTDYIDKTLSVNMSANTKRNTGNNEDWKTKNIYDLAGNIEEWTIDKNNDKYITRGGKYFEGKGSETPINSKREVDTTTSADYIGYRAMLYLK